MSAVAVPNLSLFDASLPIAERNDTPHRGHRTMRIWREVSAPRADVEPALVIESIDEDCERWDGLS